MEGKSENCSLSYTHHFTSVGRGILDAPVIL